MLKRASGGLATALLGCGSYWAVRLAYADRLASEWTRPAIEHAIHLAPLNSAYYVRWAEIDPAAALSAMRMAARLNAGNSSVWIELGQVAETNHDFETAENSLLTAVRLDKTFAPRWRLAEYYYRRRDVERFWPAMRTALAASYDDVSPLFRLCWELAPDPGTVLRQALPPRNDVLRQYLDFALQQGRLDVAEPIVTELIERASPADVPALLRCCDRLLEKHRTERALSLWNSLAGRRLLNDRGLQPAEGRSVTNGRYASPLLSHGFDWRLPGIEGIWTARAGAPSALRFTFSGQESDSSEILSQIMPVMPQRHYRLSVRYETYGMPLEPGLHWRMLDGIAGTDLLNGTGRLPASDAGEQGQQYRFDTSVDAQSVRLALGYARVPGQSPTSGSLYLRDVRLSFAE
jgi:tetratricopeptide (TPR) repeat protein